MVKTKSKKILIVVLSTILSIVMVVVLLLFFPLMGKKHTEVWSAKQEFKLDQLQTVEKNSNQDFKILLLTDTQLWMNPKDNKACYDQIRKLVAQTTPDLIATVGDNVSGVTSRFLLKEWIDVMDSFQIPWAPVFGNHDSEIPMTTLNWQGDQLLKSEYCLFQKGPSNLYGCGNYAVNITEKGEPIYTLFLLDNGRYYEYEDGSKREIYMGYEQIAWYEWNVKGIEKAAGRLIPSMTFSHFALPEMRQAVEKNGIYNESDKSYTISDAYGFGKCAYLPGVSPVNSGFFDRCLALSSTTHIFCGHDHENNASITHQGITMTYGLKTGPSPAPWNSAEETGGTIITIHTASNQTASVDVQHIPIS